MKKYAAVVVNLSRKTEKEIFHYIIPPHLAPNLQIGCRVIVPIGKQQKEGFVIDLPESTEVSKLKEIKELIDLEPIVPLDLVKIALWVSEAYLCPIYRALEYIIPPYARIKKDQWVKFRHPEENLSALFLLDEELKNLGIYLSKGSTMVSNLQRVFGANSELLLKDLENRGLVEFYFDYQLRGKSKQITEVEAKVEKNKLPEVLENLKRAKKQWEILDFLVHNGPLPALDLCSRFKTTLATINALEQKGLVQKKQIDEQRIPQIYPEFVKEEKLKLILNESQNRAILEISKAIETNEHQTFLLHGVTGSGKTEVYIKAIEKALEMGKGALVLVPEIALTPQTIGRFSSSFKEQVVVLHSRLSQGERLDAWQSLKKGIAKIVVGVRSGVFAPVLNLGLIIIDEEHESTFKQSEPDPRYHARDVALERTRINKGVLILGSATPSIESYYQTEMNNYRLLEMPKRVLDQKLPEALVVDMRKELMMGNKSIISNTLKEYIQEALSNEEQVILFLNRRGYSTFVLCRECGQALECKNCAIALTYHAFSYEMKCHYCSHTQPVPKRCPSCGSGFIKHFGTGTQQVENEIKSIWPESFVDRLDIDTTQNKNDHQKILAKFSRGETNILIGTQMVTKGLDFPNVTVVGVIAADMALNLPEYSAGEKTFQLITQVAGRAGRGNKAGRVVIQTYNPEHYAILTGKEQNYHKFYKNELEVRKIMDYPPFSFLVRILFSGTSEDGVMECCKEFALLINQKHGKELEILGPAPAPITKIKNRYRWQIILKGQKLQVLKEAAQESFREISGHNKHEMLRIIIDIEPKSIL